MGQRGDGAEAHVGHHSQRHSGHGAAELELGALSTYVMLNVSVIVFCWFQLKQRKGAKAVFMHLVFPALGALVCFAILMSVGTVALVTGVVFILIGIAYYLVLTRVLHRQINLG